MDCQAIEKYEVRSPNVIERVRHAVSRGFTLMRPGYPKLDLEVMSDYMKRDMGFLDGRDPHRDNDLPGQRIADDQASVFRMPLSK